MGTVLIKKPVIDPRYAFFNLAIRESKIHRRGVYALERIPARRKVIEYTGEKISRRETKRRGDGDITYLFTLDDYWTLDGAFGGSGAEIINHSCEPNAFLRDREMVALTCIEPWQQITFNYNTTEYDMAQPFACQCGSRSCAGEIRGYRWLSAAEKSRLRPFTAAHLTSAGTGGAGTADEPALRLPQARPCR